MEIIKKIHEMDLDVSDYFINENGNLVIEVVKFRFIVLYPMKDNRYKFISTIKPPEPVCIYDENEVLKKIKEVIDVYHRFDQEV